MKPFKRLGVLVFLLPLHLALPGMASAQVPAGWDATDLQISRQELEELLARYESILNSPGYSEELREDAQQSADLIRSRLQNGDFSAGDRIAIQLTGAPEQFPDTLLVEGGPAVTLPNMGQISLRGILRSELQDHLIAEIGRFIRNPQLTAQPLVRLSVQGAVQRPGFYVFPSEALLGDVIMAAGGPLQDSRLDDIRIRRGEDMLMRGGEVQGALDRGRSIDQLGLRDGDEVSVPQRLTVIGWGLVIQWGLVIVSTVFLGRRIF